MRRCSGTSVRTSTNRRAHSWPSVTSFQDDHINRLIYQALSIPSFVLIIVTPSIATPADTERLRAAATKSGGLSTDVKSKRILVITGGEKIRQTVCT